MEGGHYPVLWQAVLRLLDPRPGEVYLDMNLGRGGHLMKIAPHLGEEGLIVAIDADPSAVAWARENLLPKLPCPAHFVVAWSDEIDRVLSELQVGQADLVLFDLGVSSVQLRDPAKGFSFERPGPLLLTYRGEEAELTARDIVNHWGEGEIADLLYELGDERYARRIARLIVEARRSTPLKTTTDLAEICVRAYPPHARRGRIHPATRTFLALRLFLNRELERLERALPKAATQLREGGRLTAIGFMSKEVRLIRQFLRRHRAFSGEPLPDGGYLEITTPRAVRPSREEVRQNPPSRSAVLRAARKVFPGAEGPESSQKHPPEEERNKPERRRK